MLVKTKTTKMLGFPKKWMVGVPKLPKIIRHIFTYTYVYIYVCIYIYKDTVYIYTYIRTFGGNSTIRMQLWDHGAKYQTNTLFGFNDQNGILGSFNPKFSYDLLQGNQCLRNQREQIRCFKTSATVPAKRYDALHLTHLERCPLKPMDRAAVIRMDRSGSPPFWVSIGGSLVAANWGSGCGVQEVQHGVCSDLFGVDMIWTPVFQGPFPKMIPPVSTVGFFR